MLLLLETFHCASYSTGQQPWKINNNVRTIPLIQNNFLWFVSMPPRNQAYSRFLFHIWWILYNVHLLLQKSLLNLLASNLEEWLTIICTLRIFLHKDVWSSLQHWDKATTMKVYETLSTTAIIREKTPYYTPPFQPTKLIFLLYRPFKQSFCPLGKDWACNLRELELPFSILPQWQTNNQGIENRFTTTVCFQMI